MSNNTSNIRNNNMSLSSILENEFVNIFDQFSLPRTTNATNMNSNPFARHRSAPHTSTEQQYSEYMQFESDRWRRQQDNISNLIFLYNQNFLEYQNNTSTALTQMRNYYHYAMQNQNLNNRNTEINNIYTLTNLINRSYHESTQQFNTNIQSLTDLLIICQQQLNEHNARPMSQPAAPRTTTTAPQSQTNRRTPRLNRRSDTVPLLRPASRIFETNPTTPAVRQYRFDFIDNIFDMNDNNSRNSLTAEQIAQSTETVTWDASMNESRCPICWEDFAEGETICKIKHCGHIFKQSCATHWFQTNTMCPVCRYDLRSEYNSTPIDVSSNRNHSTYDDSFINLLSLFMGDRTRSDLSANNTENIRTSTDASGNYFTATYTVEYPDPELL